MKTHYIVYQAFATLRSYCLLLVTIMLLSATASYGQLVAPPLGAASSFTLFTAVGAFNSAGASVVVGNIGTNAGAFSWFPTGTLTGNMHVTNVLSTQAAIAVETAYLNATGIGGAAVLTAYGAAPAQTLSPGAYEVSAATVLAGELILDGQNDHNALFFLRVGGALTTADGSLVTLTNGAQARNVYWQVNGLLTLGQNSLMQGTLLVNGSVNFGQEAELRGRALVRAGAISLDTNLVTAPAPDAPLPVTLTSFSATGQARQVLVQWTTASEQNSARFEVERSATGTDGWKTVATVDAAGNSQTARSYRIADVPGRPGLVYYRLRSVDTDQSYAFSSVRAVAFGAADDALATRFPNPVLDRLTVTGLLPGSWLTLIDLTGQTRQRLLAGPSGTELLETSQLPPGSYLLRTVSATGTATHLKVQKQ